ncbi:hypothetical protein PCANC_21848 [Puccinia coronata f. sp. avenae]|uniref:Vacuolar ATPase assembly protein VMA22 n=1 Tax=Puccinia coronata f. sp. avenae TaxID=200324 RepID=A0A2N5S6J8_9BASI|nr:hypothetical protein PCANC_21848 [Puccinia coronata f. sp. avenae]
MNHPTELQLTKPDTSHEKEISVTAPKKGTRRNAEEEEDALDGHLFACLNLLDQYSQSYDDLQSQLRSAFLNLSKAKSILGYSRVGLHSYDMSARVPNKTVSIHTGTSADPYDLDHIHALDREETFRLVHHHDDHNGTAIRDTAKEASSSSAVAVKKCSEWKPGSGAETTARNRKKKHAAEKPHQSNEDPAHPDDDDHHHLDQNETTNRRNPITQFSPLPPPPLLHAQSHFDTSLHSIIRIVNLRADILSMHSSIIQNQKNHS